MYLYKLLSNDFEITLINHRTEEFIRNLVIVSAYIAKGLEFDAVIVYSDKDNSYSEKEKYLFYVACTRAQHQLIVYNQYI